MEFGSLKSNELNRQCFRRFFHCPSAYLNPLEFLYRSVLKCPVVILSYLIWRGTLGIQVSCQKKLARTPNQFQEFVILSETSANSNPVIIDFHRRVSK